MSSVKNSLHGLAFLLMMIISATLSGLSALLFERFEIWHNTYIPWLNQWLMHYGHMSNFQLSALHAITIVVVLFLILWLRDNFFKGTDGTGIPQIIVALRNQANHKPYSDVLTWRILIGKILLLFLAIAVGLTVGREGPSVQVGACFMFLLLAKTMKTSSAVNRGIILAGAAAGLAAAFNTPIAAFIFSIEECAKSFEKDNIILVNLIILIACLACIAFLTNYYFLHEQKGLIFFFNNISSTTPFLERFVKLMENFKLFYFLIPISIVSGLLGGCFSKFVCVGTLRISGYYRNHPNWTRIALGLFIVIIGFLSHGLSYGSGYPKTIQILTDAANPMLFPTFPWYYPITKALSCAGSLISGIPGGLFDPSFSASASLGQWIAYSLHITNMAQTKIIILITMTAYFSGVVQSPVTAFFIITEMTGTYNLAIPLGIASMIACYCSKFVCRQGIYEFLADNFSKSLSASNNITPSKL